MNINYKLPYYPAVDIYKFFASFLVVTIHTKPLGLGTDATYFLSSFCRIAVPFFFCISSFIFYQKDSSIKSYVKRMLKLYAVWFVIEIPFIYLRFFRYGFTPDSLFEFLRGLLWRNTFYASWFITASWQGMFLTYISFKKIGNIATYIIGIILFMVAAFSSLYNGFVTNENIKSVLDYLELENSFVEAIPYFIIGKILSDTKCKLNNVVLWLLFGIVLGITEVIWLKGTEKDNDVFFSLPIITTCSVLLLTNIHKTSISSNILKYMRNMSILIYLLHFPIFIIVSIFTNNSFFFVLILSICFSYLIIKASAFYPIIKNLL